MVFKSKIDQTFIVLYSGIILLLIAIVIFSWFDAGWTASLVLASIFTVVLFWIFGSYFTLKVKIEGQNLIVKIFGIVFYKSEITNITKIKVGETLWSGVHKYGTSTKGLIISSKFKDDLYISPIEKEMFIKSLKSINENIVIDF